jgi:hypothetical protein
MRAMGSFGLNIDTVGLNATSGAGREAARLSESELDTGAK